MDSYRQTTASEAHPGVWIWIGVHRIPVRPDTLHRHCLGFRACVVWQCLSTTTVHRIPVTLDGRSALKIQLKLTVHEIPVLSSPLNTGRSGKCGELSCTHKLAVINRSGDSGPFGRPGSTWKPTQKTTTATDHPSTSGGRSVWGRRRTANSGLPSVAIRL